MNCATRASSIQAPRLPAIGTTHRVLYVPASPGGASSGAVASKFGRWEGTASERAHARILAPRRPAMQPTSRTRAISRHTVERWQERVERGASPHDAHGALRDFLAGGRVRP